MPTPPEVIAAARAAQARRHVPASVSIAQWKIESGNGAHQPGNNGFGMKPRKGLNDPCQQLGTTEWDKAKKCYVPCKQPFRIFPSIADAFMAHAELVATAPVYADAMAALPNRDLFIDRMAAHYATDPLYASKIKAIIKSSGLAQYDLGMLADHA